jgi:hypothetical protein
MSKPQQQSRLRELIGTAKARNIEVRSEKLLREVGYRARSGRCRVNGKDLILLDRDASVSEQVEFLATALAGAESENR